MDVDNCWPKLAKLVNSVLGFLGIVSKKSSSNNWKLKLDYVQKGRKVAMLVALTGFWPTALGWV